MDVDLIFKIAAIGIVVAVLNQVLSRAGRDEQAMMTTLAALVVVLRILRLVLEAGQQKAVVTVQMAVRQQGVLVELGRVLLPENLEKLQETYIAAVAAALQSLLLEQELLLVEMAVVHQVENQPPIILAAVAAAMMATAALASL